MRKDPSADQRAPAHCHSHDIGPASGQQRSTVRRSSRTQTAFYAATVFFLSLSGCQSAMPSSNDSAHGRGAVVSNEFPLRFKKHNFEAHCYDTIGCSVLYNDHYHIRSGPEDVSGSPTNGDYRKNWGVASYLGVQNFPEPAVVKWKSKDGQAHEALVDIGSIFKDQAILHKVPQSDVVDNALINNPDVFLEVNDRTITVYMKAHIPTRQQQIPGNKYSDFRDDLIPAWSQTY